MQSYSWILLALCLFVGASYQYVNYSSFTRTIYTTTMTPDQVIPEPFNSDGFGAVVCEYDRNVKQLDCTVQHGGMPDVYAVAIRHADRRQNGPIVYSFTQPTGHSPFPTNFRELFQLEDQSDYPAFQQELDFLNGLWYIELYTEKPELDSIRGQLEHVDSLFAILTVDETFPPAWGSPSRGIALASYTRFNPLRQADFDVVHNVVNPTWAETGHGKLKTPGENVFTFKSPDSPIIENYQYTIGEERELLKDRQFVQVGSDLNPQGEIRGQLLRVDPIPEISFTGRMDSSQLGPTGKSFARGCILVAYDCDSRLMEYLVFHDVNQATKATAQVGPPGSTGPIAFELAGAVSPIFGTRVLSKTEEFFLLSQQMYIVIESLRYPEGEIRGQISAQYEFYAYLSGTQVVPPLSTAAVGCATFTLEEARVLDYELLHDVPLATATELRNGVVGESGPVTVEFRSPSRLLYGADVTLDDDDLSDLYLNRLYVEIRSEENPAGEVRGQLLRIKPCNAEHQDLPYDTGANPLKLPITYSGSLSGEAFFSLGLLLICLFVAFQLPN